MAAFGEKNYPEAITCLTEASKRITDSPDLYYHLGCAHLLNGELDPAAVAFQAAFNLNPKHGETLAGLAQLAYYTNQLPRARVFFREALEAETASDESRASILTGLALTEAALGHNDQARLCLLRAQRVSRRYAPAYYNLGALYLSTYSLREEALDQFELFVRLADPASPYQEKARKQISRLRVAVDRAKAEELDALRRDPDLAARRLHEGIDAQIARQFPKALKCYREALAADPLAFNAAFGLGKLYRDLKQPAEALEAFKRAAAINPAHQDSQLQAAALAVQLKRYDEAERILDLAIARSPFTPESADLMARIRYAQGRYAEAREYGQFYLSLLSAEDKGRAAYEKWVNALPK